MKCEFEYVNTNVVVYVCYPRKWLMKAEIFTNSRPFCAAVRDHLSKNKKKGKQEK